MSEGSAEMVDVLIRCALQIFDDTPVKCPIDWTVRELKECLSVLCTSKPEVKRQRLIYAGHCLQDNSTLRSIFELRPVEESVRVIHLVCPPKDINELDGLRKRNTNNTNDTRSTSVPTASQLQNSHDGVPVQSTSNTFRWPEVSGSYNMQYNLETNAQLQNAYNAYMLYYANYMQQMMYAMGQNPVTDFATSAFVPNNQYVYMPHAPAAVPQPREFNAPEQPPVAAQPNLPAAPAAGGLVQEAFGGEIEAPQRDFLDVVYKAIRMCFLIMLVYVYSSVERFIGVLLFILAVWFLQARRDHNNRQRNERELAEAVDNVRQPQPQAADGGEDDEVTNDISSNGNNRPNSNGVNDHTAWNVFWSTCYTFVTSFFTSLIPENPIPVNVN